MLERLNGKSVSKAFSDKKFADIHYIRDMMLEASCFVYPQQMPIRPQTFCISQHMTPHLPEYTQVFTALDKAQRAFGYAKWHVARKSSSHCSGTDAHRCSRMFCATQVPSL